MLTEMYNIVGFQITKKLNSKQRKSISQTYSIPQHMLEFDKRIYHQSRGNYPFEESISRKDLTPDDVRILIQSEEEIAQAKGFKRLLPSVEYTKYLKYLDNVSRYEMLLADWEAIYQNKREEARQLLSDLCSHNVHLQCEDEE